MTDRSERRQAVDADAIRSTRRSWPVAVVVALAVVVAGAGQDEARKDPAKDAPAPQVKAAGKWRPKLTDAEAEADALAFVRENHAELAAVLAQLKAMRPDEYRRAVRDLEAVSQNLAEVKARNPARYAVALDVWKARSRVDLLAARLATAAASDADQERQLRLAVEALVDAEVRQQRLEKETVEENLRKYREAAEARIKKYQEALERLESNRGSVVEARTQALLKRGRRAHLKTQADQGASKTRTQTKGERQP